MPMNPFLSIVVPVYDQWHLVPALLEKLSEQDAAEGSFELVLVDNGSAVLAPPGALPAFARLEHEARAGSYAARNRGVSVSSGQWLAFTDADCLPRRNWVSAIIARATALGDDMTMIAGPVEVTIVSAKPSRYEIYDSFRGIPQERYVKRNYAATANLAMARSIFDRLGGFDPSRLSGGDFEFCRRAARSGVDLELERSMIVDHPPRRTLEELSNKVRRIKAGQLQGKSLTGKLATAMRTLAPPWVSLWRIATKPNAALEHKLVVAVVQFQLWGVEVRELAKLSCGGSAERR